MTLIVPLHSIIENRKNYLCIDQVYTAMEIFQQIHGHCRVSSNFTVPSQEPWPSYLWGRRLGWIRSSLRKGSYLNQEAYEDKLRKLGFDFEARIDKRGFEKFFLALKNWKRINGTTEVPWDYSIPHHDDAWPEETWGLNLGSRRRSILYGNAVLSEEQTRRLLDIGFNFEHGTPDTRGFEYILQAFLLYKAKEGTLDIPQKFSVPVNSTEWPEELWGMKLGVKANDIRRGCFAEHKEELDKIGFVWDVRTHRFGLIKKALLIYREIEGTLDVRQAFVVPSQPRLNQGAWENIWPRELWGMKLGNRVRDIRQGRYAKFREELDEIGFVWISERAPSRERQFNLDDLEDAMIDEEEEDEVAEQARQRETAGN